MMLKKALTAAVLAAALITPSAFAQQVPRQAGDWSAQTLDKKILKLEQFRNKYVVLAFLLTT